jgi:hypothetical protein
MFELLFSVGGMVVLDDARSISHVMLHIMNECCGGIL